MGTVFSKRGGLQLTMFYSIKMRSAQQQAVGQRHISGAERIVNKDKVDKTTLSMIQRALAHERGRADFINIKIGGSDRDGSPADSCNKKTCSLLLNNIIIIRLGGI